MGNRGKMALFFYCASHADMPSVSLVARVIARDGRLELTNRQVQTDRQTDRQITHAAHARRGLMKVQTLGTNIRPGVDGRAKELLRVRSARVNKKSCTAERLVARCLTTLLKEPEKALSSKYLAKYRVVVSTHLLACWLFHAIGKRLLRLDHRY